MIGKTFNEYRQTDSINCYEECQINLYSEIIYAIYAMMNKRAERNCDVTWSKYSFHTEYGQWNLTQRFKHLKFKQSY